MFKDEIDLLQSQIFDDLVNYFIKLKSNHALENVV